MDSLTSDYEYPISKVFLNLHALFHTTLKFWVEYVTVTPLKVAQEKWYKYSHPYQWPKWYILVFKVFTSTLCSSNAFSWCKSISGFTDVKIGKFEQEDDTKSAFQIRKSGILRGLYLIIKITLVIFIDGKWKQDPILIYYFKHNITFMNNQNDTHVSSKPYQLFLLVLK